MDMCVDDPDARLAKQLDRQINEELERAKQKMVRGLKISKMGTEILWAQM